MRGTDQAHPHFRISDEGGTPRDRARRAGKVGPSGKPVSDRTIEHELKFLIAVLNWAAKARDEQGKLFLASNPLRGLKAPTEKNPNRVVLSEEELARALAAEPRHSAGVKQGKRPINPISSRERTR